MRTLIFSAVWKFSLILTFTFNYYSMQDVYSFPVPKDSIELDGWWENNSRSAFSIPIVAYYDKQFVYIKNTSSLGDITITICNSDGEEMYCQTILAPQTDYMLIPISTFPNGEYSLLLTNQYGGILQGNFYHRK